MPASEDASFRRYFRVQADESLIVMDAPPPQEDCRPFIAIAAMLEKIGLNGVKVLETNLDEGFLLLSDLGSLQYLQALRSDPECAQSLYTDALDALLRMQEGGAAFEHQLSQYDDARLRAEMSLFREWLCEHHLGLEFSPHEESAWINTLDGLSRIAAAQSQVIVHRDYHSRNLMVMESDNPGILDFQDAVAGPLTYDLVSLLKDCYIKWPRSTIEEYVRYFYDRSAIASRQSMADFVRDFDLMGVQRHLKASGIFARLMHRDGKTGFLKDVPHTLSYIVDITPHYEELSFLGEFVERRVLPILAEADE
ncbi:MAG: aminoglycoside phosphotransferase family protein [Woeseiaceae bacterium]